MRLLRTKLTDGERRRLLAYGVVALFGAGMAFVAVTQLGHGELLERPMRIYEKWIVLSGALGGVGGLFLAGETVKRNAASASPGVTRVAVLGAGLMGAQIAGQLAEKGHPVVLRDISPSILAKAMSGIY